VSSSLLTPRPSRRHGARAECVPRTRLRAIRLLGSYDDAAGVTRCVVALEHPDRSVLVLDCVNVGLRDARVVGRILAEEPTENPALLARMYLDDPRRTLPRRLEPDDLSVKDQRSVEKTPAEGEHTALCDAAGATFSIASVTVHGALSELRWTRTAAEQSSEPHPVSLRHTLGALERYEPARTITLNAIETAGDSVSVVRLRGELQRIERSPIVLNRGLRKAVQQAVRDGTSLSEIAIRCGRLKSDPRGNRSGETSWLTRRIGAMPEGGQARPTPWIHSDTLALIAREGLGVSPREVEL
jgi:hypothetical protein